MSETVEYISPMAVFDNADRRRREGWVDGHLWWSLSWELFDMKPEGLALALRTAVEAELLDHGRPKLDGWQIWGDIRHIPEDVRPRSAKVPAPLASPVDLGMFDPRVSDLVARVEHLSRDLGKMEGDRNRLQPWRSAVDRQLATLELAQEKLDEQLLPDLREKLDAAHKDIETLRSLGDASDMVLARVIDLPEQVGALHAEIENLRARAKATEHETATLQTKLHTTQTTIASRLDALEGLVDRLRSAVNQLLSRTGLADGKESG